MAEYLYLVRKDPNELDKWLVVDIFPGNSNSNNLMAAYLGLHPFFFLGWTIQDPKSWWLNTYVNR